MKYLKEYLMSICLHHKCTLCCHSTEMPLSNEDIAKIQNLGYEENFFVREKQGLKYLKNRRGRCVFLECNCAIYENRPEGCKLYPVVLDSRTGRAILDELCPFQKEFHVSFKKSLRITRLYFFLTRQPNSK